MSPAERAKPHEPMDAALEAAFRRHYRNIVAVATRIATSDVEAEELAQEAFLRLWEAPVLYQPADEVRAWLFRVVTNLALNAVRGRQRERARLTKLGSLELPEAAARAYDADPVRIIVHTEEREQVRAVLQQLPPRARACLALRYSGLSYAEIARVLGTTPGSVGTMLARAELAFTERWKRYANAV